MAVPVLHRQAPARERYHLPTMGQVEVIEWCPTEHVLRAAGLSATRTPAPTFPHPPRLAPCPSTLCPTCAPLSGRPRTKGSACPRKPRPATMLTARCIVACDRCSRRTGATTVRHAGRCSLRPGQPSLFPTKGIRRGAGSPEGRAGGALAPTVQCYQQQGNSPRHFELTGQVRSSQPSQAVQNLGQG